MTVLLGHFDGQRVILESPIPRGMRANTPVKVMVESTAVRSKNAHTSADKLPSLASLKARLTAGSNSSLAKARANSIKLIGRPRI